MKRSRGANVRTSKLNSNVRQKMDNKLRTQLFETFNIHD